MTLSVQMIAVLAAACLGFGWLLLGALALVLPERGRVLGLMRIMGVETVIVAVVVGSFLVGGTVLRLALAALVCRTTLEAARVNRLSHPEARIPPMALSAALGVAAVLMPLAGPAGVVAVLACWIGLAALGVRQPLRRDVAPLLFPGLPALGTVALATGSGTAALALAAYLTVEIFDSFSLFFGKLFGRRRAFPRLSPGKTVEGLAGGAAALCLFAALGAAALAELRLGPALALALLVGAAGLAGDLAGSAIKRRAGVKDYPGGIPHQGGVLDIADSWIAVTACLGVWAALGGL